MDHIYDFFATAPRGLEPLLADELRALGAAEVAETRAGVAFQGPLALAYRVCLWSRLASRVLLALTVFEAGDTDALYAGVRDLAWEDHLAADGTLAVDARVRRSRIQHSRYAALRVKDAVVDRFRDRCGVRPSVDVTQPDVRLNLHLERDRATLSLDLSGDSLHRRGYRTETGIAPLKENLAAAVLMRAGWPEIAAAGGALLDPMCGSGTLVIEAALLAGDVAPGLMRRHWGFDGWQQHHPEVWQTLLSEARQRQAVGLRDLPPLLGCDCDGHAIAAACRNARQAGLPEQVRFEKHDLAHLHGGPVSDGAPGLVVTNPPYGERLGEVAKLGPLYHQLGEALRRDFVGWQAAVLTGNPDLAKQVGIRARRLYKLYNGALECRLLCFDVEPHSFFGADAPAVPLSDGARMFANRLRKNMRRQRRWAKKAGVTCYRLYDADLPEYAVAIDWYEGRVHVQEYQAPPSIDPDRAARRLREMMRALPEVLEVAPDAIALKVRRRQKGASQYQKLDQGGERFAVGEDGCRFWVNLTDHLDTGLFLDHRPTRALLRGMAAGKRFLNLFGYTGAATVQAARGGAVASVTVDLSRTYLDWARANFALNTLDLSRHRLVQDDVLAFLEHEQERFDLIFLDPPTFSRSKRMQDTLDIQRDHVDLLRRAAALLAPDGTLIFSNNFRKFRMDKEALPELNIEDISAATIPSDFARNPRIHNCWRITRR